MLSPVLIRLLNRNPPSVLFPLNPQVLGVHVFFHSLFRQFTLEPDLPVQPHVELLRRYHTAERRTLIQKLRPFLPRLSPCTRRVMDDPHPCVGGVLMLPSGSACGERLYFTVVYRH